MKSYFSLLLLFFPLFIWTQVPDIYFGAGNQIPVVIASDEAQLYSGTETARSVSTIDGRGMLADRMDAARFLYQAGFGANQADIDSLLTIGFETWIDNQFLKTPT